MNDDHDKLGSAIKRAVEAESAQLSLAPHVRRTVIAACERGRPAGGWGWLCGNKWVAVGGVGVIAALLLVRLTVSPKEPHLPQRVMDVNVEVYGGKNDDYWKKKYAVIRTQNGQEGYIEFEATWPKQRSAISL